MSEAIAAADTAWVLAAMAAVAMMIPGLALFYGGMVSVRHTLNMMSMVLVSAAVAAIMWVAVGYSMILGNSLGGLGLVGNPLEYFGLRGIMAPADEPGLPPALVAGFQMLFAGITVALVAGALAERVKFGAWLVFSAVWSLLVYYPVAHWVFAFDSDDGSIKGGWIANTLDAVDFAGGTAVHMNAGIAGLAVALVVGKRNLFPRVSRPHSVPLAFLGAGLLFFGWFGFNGGSALAADNTAGVAVFNTAAAALAGVIGWLIVENLRTKKITGLGAVSGLIGGLVAITPAAGAVSPLGAVAIGLFPSAICYFAVNLKFKWGYDDSLDVMGLHYVAGLLGTLLIGFLADPDAPAGAAGLFYGGGLELLGRQTVASLATTAYVFTVTYAIAWLIQKTMGLRSAPEDEQEGLDVAYHGEKAYNTEVGGSLKSAIGKTPVHEAKPDLNQPGVSADVDGGPTSQRLAAQHTAIEVGTVPAQT